MQGDWIGYRRDPLESIHEIAVAVFPNPNIGIFTVRFMDNVRREVSVTDNLGKTVIPIRRVQGDYTITLPPAITGDYFLKIVEGKREKSIHVAIKRSMKIKVNTK